MSGFTRVSREQKCPICKRDNWCMIGERVIKCMRIQSPRACPSGGWYHQIDAPVMFPKGYRPVAPKPADAVTINPEAMMERWRSRTPAAMFDALAVALGVTAASLVRLGAAFAPEHNAWAFPMHDGEAKTIGIRLRNQDGYKWAVKGSRQGIFIPEPEQFVFPTRAYLPEGPTDTAALLSMGLFAIGRPTCETGHELIRDALGVLNIREVVVVADNDVIKQFHGTEGRPGMVGAMKLRAFLKLRSVLWYPSGDIKDVREFYQRGGTAALIESDIRNRIWSTQ